MKHRKDSVTSFVDAMMCAVLLGCLGPLAVAETPAGKSSGSGKPQNPILATSHRYESFERKLESFRTLPDNATIATQTARTLFQMGKSAPPALGGLVIEASCAAFIACGADASYADARKALGNPRDFEANVLDRCSSCEGSGRSSEECRECHGSGRCPIPNCNGGRRYLPKVGMVACPTCKGTGRCQDCKGSGKRVIRCPGCGGTGRRINRDSAQNLYRERIDEAIEECRRNEVVPTSATGAGKNRSAAISAAVRSAIASIHGQEKTRAALSGIDPKDSSAVKACKVVSEDENDSGLIEVKVNVLVSKVLPKSAAPALSDDDFVF